MRWGITFLAWTLTTLYLASGCLDYVRVLQKPPPGFTRAQIRPQLEACVERKLLQIGGATVVFVSLYYSSGWAVGRRRPAPDDA